MEKLVTKIKDRLLMYVNIYHIRITTNTYQKGTLDCSFEVLYEKQREN